MRLSELQEWDEETWKIKVKDLNRYKKVNRVLYYQELLLVPETIQIKSLTNIKTTFWQAIVELIKQENWLAGNIIG